MASVKTSLTEDQIQIRASDLIRLRKYASTIDFSKARRTSNVLGGGRRSAFRGRGLDFEESRLFQPGDDVRTIDWRVTARRGEPHTKVFQPERERAVVLVVDVGASMAFASQGRLKSVLAAHVAALVGWMSVSQGDKVGAFIVADEQHREIRPTTQGATLLRVFNALEQLQVTKPYEAPKSTESPGTPSSIDRALRRLAEAIRPGSLIFLAADFWRMTASGESDFTQCAQSSELVCGFTFDPWEQNLPGTDGYAFSDGRTSLTLHGDDHRIRAAYRQRFENHVSRLQSLCRRNQAHFLSLSTAEQPLSALRRGLAAEISHRV